MKLILIIISLLFFIACNKKFNSKVWKNDKHENKYVHRESMLKDLTNNHQLVGLSFDSLVSLLGMPEHSYPNVIMGKNYLGFSMSYTVEGETHSIFSTKIDFLLDKNDVVTNFQVRLPWKQDENTGSNNE